MITKEEWIEVCKSRKIKMLYCRDNKFSTKEEFSECIDMLLDYMDNLEGKNEAD